MILLVLTDLFLFMGTAEGGRDWSLSQHASSRGQGNSLSRLPVHHMADTDRQTLTLRGNLDAPISLTCDCVCAVGGNPGKHAEDHANSTLELTN